MKTLQNVNSVVLDSSGFGIGLSRRMGYSRAYINDAGGFTDEGKVIEAV